MARIWPVIALCAAACSSARAAAPDRAAPEGSRARANEPLRLSEGVTAPPRDNQYLAGPGAGAAEADAAAMPSSARAGSSNAGACPEEMALVERTQGAFCIDRWEASLAEVGGVKRARWPGNQRVPSRRHDLVARSVPDQKPQAYVSGAEAARACDNAGKRLCALDEWLRACRGPRGRAYPYGEQREAGRCNERFRFLTDHPVVALFERSAARETDPARLDRSQMWGQAFMNDPRLYDMPHGVEPTGSYPGCQSEYGVYDMVGNLHEWVDDPSGTFVGGFFMDTQQNGEGCGYRTRAHDFDYHDYSTGFRCCKDAG